MPTHIFNFTTTEEEIVEEIIYELAFITGAAEIAAERIEALTASLKARNLHADARFICNLTGVTNSLQGDAAKLRRRLIEYQETQDKLK